MHIWVVVKVMVFLWGILRVSLAVFAGGPKEAVILASTHITNGFYFVVRSIGHPMYTRGFRVSTLG